MSNQIISSVVAQVAEEKDINVVLTELFSSDGSETYIRPVEMFVDLEENDTWTFWDVALKARQRREVAVGYKPAQMNYIEAEELIVNPPNKATPRKWSKGASGFCPPINIIFTLHSLLTCDGTLPNRRQDHYILVRRLSMLEIV